MESDLGTNALIIRFESATIKVSVNDKTQSDLEKSNPFTNINWVLVETQLRKWRKFTSYWEEAYSYHCFQLSTV